MTPQPRAVTNEDYALAEKCAAAINAARAAHRLPAINARVGPGAAIISDLTPAKSRPQATMRFSIIEALRNYPRGLSSYSLAALTSSSQTNINNQLRLLAEDGVVWRTSRIEDGRANRRKWALTERGFMLHPPQPSKHDPGAPSDVRARVLETVRAASAPMSVAEIGAQVGSNVSYVKKQLFGLEAAGKVRRGIRKGVVRGKPCAVFEAVRDGGAS